MDKHTPGPWTATLLAHVNQRWVESADRHNVCKLMGENSEANARLIAAAPSLLTTTKIAYTILADVRHEWPGRNTAEGQAALAAMRDAIAAAEGSAAQDVQDHYGISAALSRATGKE